MKLQRMWVVWAVLLTASVSAWAYSPGGYHNMFRGVGLGIRVADMAFEELDRMGLEYGVRVLEVAPNGPAAGCDGRQ